MTATTGWAGSALAKGIFESQVLKLVGAISKSNSSKVLGSFIDQVKNTLLILSTVAEVLLSKPEVFIEYAKPEVVKRNILKLHSWHRELNNLCSGLIPRSLLRELAKVAGCLYPVDCCGVVNFDI